MSQNEPVTSVDGEVSQKSMHKEQNFGDVSIS